MLSNWIREKLSRRKIFKQIARDNELYECFYGRGGIDKPPPRFIHFTQEEYYRFHRPIGAPCGLPSGLNKNPE